MNPDFKSKYYDYSEMYNEILDWGNPYESYFFVNGKEIIEKFFDFISSKKYVGINKKINYQIILHLILEEATPYLGKIDYEPTPEVYREILNGFLFFKSNFLYYLFETQSSIIKKLENQQKKLKKLAVVGSKFAGGRKVSRENLKDYYGILEKAKRLSPHHPKPNFRNATFYYLKLKLNKAPNRKEIDDLYRRFNKYYLNNFKNK
jgi:hypothetical protein